MTALDPAEIFRAEAAELLACLETTLLDLGDRPEDRALIDTAFRALHTIKGSGAMFGFEQVAAFTHDFETAFDRVRRGEVPVGRDLVNVSLSAKDFIRGLIEEPEASAPIIGEAILAELEQLLGAAGADAAQAAADTAADTAAASAAASDAPPAEAGWRIGIAFAPDVLRNGTNPLALLDELRDLGACTVVPRLEALPELPGLDPESLALGWDVTLRGPVSRAAVEDVFLFVRDEMVLTLEPAGPALPDA
ncbi:chemotaxis protein CheA, partial [Methylobacterium radiotolerans]